MKRLLFLSCTALHVWGACHVVTPTGSGTHSGNDWNNACTGFSGNCSTSNMVRGDSYYLGKGLYSAPDFDKANSGTLTITITVPTVGDHCTDTGFVSATHVGQAEMSNSTWIDTDYWIIDGKYGTPGSKGSYGFKFKWASPDNSDPLYCNQGCSHSIIRYFELQGSNYADNFCDDGLLVTGYNHPTTNTNDLLVEYGYVYQGSGAFKFNSVSNVTLQHNFMDENYSNSSCHGENLATQDAQLTVRYNVFKNCVGTACMATPCAVCGVSQFEVYGNVFYKTTGACTDNGGSAICLSSIFRNLGNTVNTLKIYNNTFANFSAAGMASGSVVDVWFNSSGSTSGDDFKNNLFYNNGPIELGNGSTCSSNSYYSTTRNSAACTGDQTGGVGNPFVSSGTGNFHLASDTSSWSSIASPYNLDPDGVTRSSSRGAYQFGAGGSSAPTVTTSAVSSIGTTTATGNGNVTSDGGDTVTARGVCVGTSPSPTSTCFAAAAGGTGTYTASMTGLSSNTFYYVAAYATNSVGTSYGSDVTFTTSTISTSSVGIRGKASIGGKGSVH